jgi:hypothetical protein
VWFTAGAELRKNQFREESITSYDAAMKEHLTAVIEGLVAVAHRDPEAYRALYGIVREVWALDVRVAMEASTYGSEPETAISSVADLKPAAERLVMGLPDQIVGVLGERSEG